MKKLLLTILLLKVTICFSQITNFKVKNFFEKHYNKSDEILYENNYEDTLSNFILNGDTKTFTYYFKKKKMNTYYVDSIIRKDDNSHILYMKNSNKDKCIAFIYLGKNFFVHRIELGLPTRNGYISKKYFLSIEN